MKETDSKNILVCGVGAIGSNLVARLVPDLKGQHKITILDRDKVEERNVTAGTQFYTPDQVGLPKVEALQYNIYKWYQREIEILHKEVTDNSSFDSILSEVGLTNLLIVDCFDNFSARRDVQNRATHRHLDCLHVGFSDSFTFAIEWAENYAVPSDITSGMDICEMPGAAAFVTSAASLGALVVEEFLRIGKKIDILGGKFSHNVVK